MVASSILEILSLRSMFCLGIVYSYMKDNDINFVYGVMQVVSA